MYDASPALMVNMYVIVYTKEPNRPWGGLVVALYPESKEFDIHWFEVRVNQTLHLLIHKTSFFTPSFAESLSQKVENKLSSAMIGPNKLSF